ncbi:MAG: RNA methyltransferase [Clostridiaceae bacterium]|nr:RNA methyltransferase [Clostridiaceae bacterium]
MLYQKTGRERQMILIESKDNPRYKALLALKKARQAKKEQLMILEGPRPLMDLAAAGRLPRTLIFSQDDKGDRAARELLGPGGVFEGKMDPDQLIRLPAHLFRQASAHKTDQGVMALIHLPVRDLGDWLDRKLQDQDPCRILILESVQDPGNVGSLIRTADALGWQAVILMGDSASIYNPKTLAASMGSLLHMALFEVQGPVESLLEDLKARGIKLLGAALGGQALEEDWAYDKKLALMLGNEGKGLSDQALAAADGLLAIPMQGGVQSLNVAAAGAILLWEAIRNL